jgi:hypothetical protein
VRFLTELPRSRPSSDDLPFIDALVGSRRPKAGVMPGVLIQQGGAYVNDRRVGDSEARLTAADLASPGVMVLRTGKKFYSLLRFVG